MKKEDGYKTKKKGSWIGKLYKSADREGDREKEVSPEKEREDFSQTTTTSWNAARATAATAATTKHMKKGGTWSNRSKKSFLREREKDHTPRVAKDKEKENDNHNPTTTTTTTSGSSSGGPNANASPLHRKEKTDDGCEIHSMEIMSQKEKERKEKAHLAKNSTT